MQVVIDEVDSIAPARKDDSEGLTERMVGALLKLMEEGGNKRVLVVACTNRPDTIDPALRRPGRFDKEIEIGKPSTLVSYFCNIEVRGSHIYIRMPVFNKKGVLKRRCSDLKRQTRDTETSSQHHKPQSK